jgi:hypothetical protein
VKVLGRQLQPAHCVCAATPLHHDFLDRIQGPQLRQQAQLLGRDEGAQQPHLPTHSLDLRLHGPEHARARLSDVQRAHHACRLHGKALSLRPEASILCSKSIINRREVGNM